ncbi:Type I restriction modification DNA specificity domain protein [Sporomusa ovata DSM 2662]|uniref:Type I restriction-modification system, specificity subunit S n=1 Tax=Sporomusa ovata TaxID=2378 RepID=A0A0U1L5P5_9FIRM|nr:restriction endonuclease subunit S [Sporomusa ovata]EQB24670.1 type I restriction-modification system specificity subunit S [Sporomusa ovata DSM 2662]CQR75016.1 Type I restriction-modification system, specificity subunit S [Sporomusa ovata]
MGKWEIKRLEDLVEVNPSVKLIKGEEYPFIDIDKVSSSIKKVTNEVVKIYDGQSSSKFKNGDTVFSRITPCLENRKIAKVKIDWKAAFGSTEFFVFRAKKGISDEDFVYYLTSSDMVVLPAINSMTGASGRQRADKRFVKRLKLRLPELPTQKRIADILSTYDDLIENNNKRIELLEKAAQELYKEWFLRFRFPNHKQTKFVNGLPEGWALKKFQGNISFITGKLDSNAMTDNGTFDFYTCAKTIYKTDTYCFDGECVLLGGNNATGDFSLFYANSKLDAYQRTYIVTPINKMIGCPYIYFVIKDYLFHFKQSSAGAATKFLTKRILDNLSIMIASESVMVDFNLKSKLLFDEIILLQRKNKKLKKQRDLLLPRLMSGRLEV